jgi:hypothetical protein
MRNLTPKSGEWTEAEQIEIERLRSACRVVDHWDVDCDRTDAGDPWCIVYDRRQRRIIVHIARIDLRYVVVCPMIQRSIWAPSLGAAVDIALGEIQVRLVPN